MKKQLVAIFLLILPFTNAFAGKMYKWTDNNGQTHFSQIQPEKQAAGQEAKVELHKVNSSRVTVNRRLDYEYCGEKKLPGPANEPKNILRNLDSKTQSWRKSLTQQRKSLNSHMRSQLASRRYSPESQQAKNERQQTLTRSIGELECALDWAARLRAGSTQVREEVNTDFKNARTRYQAEREYVFDRCGPDPKETDMIIPDLTKEKRWRRCSRKYGKNLSRYKKEMDRAENLYRQIY
ncbi:MAG: DUF4124 domain-containing protein [Gammaproteobacteria bacterium]